MVEFLEFFNKAICKLPNSKLITLLLLEYFLALITYKFFYCSTPLLANNIVAYIPNGAILRIICVGLLLKEKKEGYILAWLISVFSVSAIMTWGFYFYMRSILTINLVVFDFMNFIVDVFLFKTLYSMRAKEWRK